MRPHARRVADATEYGTSGLDRGRRRALAQRQQVRREVRSDVTAVILNLGECALTPADPMSRPQDCQHPVGPERGQRHPGREPLRFLIAPVVGEREEGEDKCQRGVGDDEQLTFLERRTTELVIAADIARRLGTSKPRVGVLASGSGSPEPVGVLGRSQVWRWSSVERWVRETARPPADA